ncbi:MAG: dTDP-glucose 4,6-dehydratase [Candidatus Moranbacteria bacterium CG23_combo_of_CG06-09_8_20_14_all_35_22]|nr:MAG: dTDP-glucose 4,6-dehydratase [Candidatus Moranbacteria bacterium CG23_combo_of_CG06-09_8_20_14_all_35_22]
MSKKLLVTGGAGFIGSNFIHYWIKKHPEDKIVNLDALTYAGNLENLKSIETPPRVDEASPRVEAGNPNYKFIKINICEKEKINEIISIEKPDAIIHFAAESHVDRSILGPEEFVRTNVLGTFNLLESARQNGNIRFHHISTDEVFGSLGPNDTLFNETTPYDPRSPYSASKASSDHLVRAYFHTFGLPITISNCSNNYGPFQFPEKLMPLFITNLIENKKIPLYGDGMNVRDWLFVEDHCEAIDLILQKGKIGETYCVGGNCEKTNKEITYKILELLGKGEEMIEFVADRKGHDRRYAIDSSKIQRELGWAPKNNFESGIEKTVTWYQENENWWKKIKSDR